MPIHSGRFKVRLPNTPGTHSFDIAKGLKGGCYRIFNSGENTFRVDSHNGGINADASNPKELQSTFSIDVAVGGDSAAVPPTDVLSIEGRQGQEVQGVYDVLGGLNPMRSGRFRFEYTNSAIQIISLNGGASPTDLVWYRILNAGDNALSVERTSVHDVEVIAVVDPAQSIDFSVGVQASKDVYIHGLSASSQLKGIYDCLGRSS